MRCAVVDEMPAWGHYSAANFLYRHFQDDQVQAAARAALKRMGPATGEMETRLLADLSALRNGDAALWRMANLGRNYGCDPRLLEYLQESLDSGDKQVRMIAVSELCSLGEPAPGLKMEADPLPEVRARLCETFGRNREQSGAEVLLSPVSR